MYQSATTEEGAASNEIEDMERAEKMLGSWMGLSLVRQFGPSEKGAHRHSSHMLSMQLEGAVRAEWTDPASSYSAKIQPRALMLLPAGRSHAKCTLQAADSREQPDQLIALINPATLQNSFGAKVELTERRGFRDLQLERMLLVLNEAPLDQASHLFGEHIANAIAVHLMTTYADRDLVPSVYRGGILRSRLTRVLERMDAQVFQPGPVSDLADAAGLSVYHFSRAFRQSMGTSPYQYLLARKVERAKSLLAEPGKSVADVAISLGFARQNHFARVFKKQTGISPKEFRQRL